MTGPPSAVGNNSAGNLHDRLPVWISHICDQNLAFLEVMDAFHVIEDIGYALADLGADRQTFDKDFAGFLEDICLHQAYFGLGMNSFRSGLNNEQFACAHINPVTIFGPFNIHGFAVMFLYDTGPF